MNILREVICDAAIIEIDRFSVDVSDRIVFYQYDAVDYH